ncbi:MAG TPA: hypothetical protein VFW41_07075 [Gaiellaceae bacterium]|nr:hypothetical protein [Gaiellaceae bacterium]
MTPPPEFEEIVGEDVEAAERARLARVHSLLVQAGPPPELSPELEAGPTLGMTLNRRPLRVRRRAMLLAATVAVVALAFLGGYIAGNGGGTANAEVLKLTGTPAAPHAFASLQIEPRDSAGNWPMRLSVTGLPRLSDHSYYEVFLVRNGKPYAPCGSFKVAVDRATTVQLNAPYRLRHSDTWVVTRQTPRNHEPGAVVLKPA